MLNILKFCCKPPYPSTIYMITVNKRNTSARCKTCLKLTIFRFSFINSEQIQHLFHAVSIADLDQVYNEWGTLTKKLASMLPASEMLTKKLVYEKRFPLKVQDLR